MIPRLRQHMHTSRPVWCTSAGVLLAHAGVVWLVIHQLASPALTGSHESVILASVVSDMPVPTAPQPAPVRTLSPLSPLRPALQQTVTPAVKTVSSEVAPGTDVPTATTALPASTAASTNSARVTPTAAPTAAPALVQPSSDADYLHNPPPAYPRMSRRMGEQGTGLARVYISAEGRAEKAEIRTSSGYARLDEAALETVQRWRYVPGKRAGQPEGMWFNVPIRFVLD